MAPRLTDLKETALHVDNLDRAKRFYEEVLGLTALVSDDRLCAFDVAGKHILLLFAQSALNTAVELPGGMIPPHGGSGSLHAAFAIEAAELPAWESHLNAHGVAVLSRVSWPAGGQSIYFRDPDGHLLELLTPGVWSTY